jgi:hypothetical protein
MSFSWSLIDWTYRWGESTSLNFCYQWPILHNPGDIWAQRTMVKWYGHWKTPDSFTRTLWQFYKQSSSSKQEERAKEMINLALRSIFVNTSQALFYVSYILRHGPTDLLPLRRKACCWIVIALKNSSPCAGFKPANFGPSEKHANHYSTETTCFFHEQLTIWSRSLSKCYSRIHFFPQTEHHNSLLQRSTG